MLDPRRRNAGDVWALQQELQRRGQVIPIIFISGQKDEDIRERALRQGAINSYTSPSAIQLYWMRSKQHFESNERESGQVLGEYNERIRHG